MPSAKFAVGDRVTFIRSTFDINISHGLFTVIRIMPRDGAGFSYRVKNERDAHERVMSEAQLSSG